MRVLVTRPADDAADTVARLAALGHQAIIAPLLDIRFREGPQLALSDVQAVLVTSANGIRALAQRTARRDMQILAVGVQSAAAAREMGFAQFEDAGGDADALAKLAIARLAPDRGALLHAAGAETRGQLAEKLTSNGFAVRTEILYDAVAATDLPEHARNAIEGGLVDAVLFFSPRTARIFADIAARENLACRSLVAVCISQAAADELRARDFREIRVAERPDQDALLSKLA